MYKANYYVDEVTVEGQFLVMRGNFPNGAYVDTYDTYEEAKERADDMYWYQFDM